MSKNPFSSARASSKAKTATKIFIIPSKWVAIIGLVLSLGYTASAVFAQQQDDSSTNNATNASSTDQSNNKTTQNNSTAAKDGKSKAPDNAQSTSNPNQVFNPTEQISDDLSVPFPVDI